MTGTVTVTKTRDWLTPFEVTVEIEGREPSTSTFMAASRAQIYAVGIADAEGLELVYNTGDLDVMQSPTNSGNRKTSRAKVTPEEFQARHKRLCRGRCRACKPLSEFRQIFHRNRTTGREVFHGYADKCLECER